MLKKTCGACGSCGGSNFLLRDRRRRKIALEKLVLDCFSRLGLEMLTD